MNDHDIDDLNGDEPMDDDEHLAPAIRAALLAPVDADPTTRERAITAALAEFDRSASSVVDLAAERRRRYSRSLSAAAAVLVVAVGISVVAPDGGDDSGGELEMSSEAVAVDDTGGEPVESRMAEAEPAMDAPATMSAQESKDESSDASGEAAVEAVPVIEQSDPLRVASTPAELQDLAFVWWSRVRSGSADPPEGHSCLVAGSTAVAVVEYRGADVIVFYDGAEDITTAVALDDCAPVERVTP
jgi:hypothetical protein